LSKFACGEYPVDRSGLHEIWPGADNVEHVHD
jgi:hypothetical protein